MSIPGFPFAKRKATNCEDSKLYRRTGSPCCRLWSRGRYCSFNPIKPLRRYSSCEPLLQRSIHPCVGEVGVTLAPSTESKASSGSFLLRRREKACLSKNSPVKTCQDNHLARIETMARSWIPLQRQ